MDRVTPGLVVSNAYSGECIALEHASAPDPSWVARQEDDRVHHVPDGTRWWTLLPLGGGALLVPEPLVEVVREASYEDFLRAIEHANADGRRRLAAVFPAYTARALASAGRDT